MPNINFELNLNKHPKDTPNRSLVAAKNVRISNDFSCLQNEEAIFQNSYINTEITGQKIVGYIPCNKEFILFTVEDKNYTDEQRTNGIDTKIWRYRESDESGSFDNPEIKCIYENFKSHGGKIKGTFTYNIKSQLILAITEYHLDVDVLVPLKTINVGTWEGINEENDLSLDDTQLPLNPELKVSELEDYNYINGVAYKGWYYFFIRYKINSVDYTKWYSLGYPILISDVKENILFNYNFITINPNDHTHIQNTMNNGSNTCNKTIELKIKHKYNNFDKYQIGFIFTTKNDKRGFKSLDLNKDELQIPIIFNNFEEYSNDELVFDKYNYYNTKNVINYKNRLYLSNYKEDEFDYNKLKILTNNIKLSASVNEINLTESKGNLTPNILVRLDTFKDSTTSNPGEMHDVAFGSIFDNENHCFSFKKPINYSTNRLTHKTYLYVGDRIKEIDCTIESKGGGVPNFRHIISFDYEDTDIKISGSFTVDMTDGGGYYKINLYRNSYIINYYYADNYNIKNTFIDRLKDRCLITEGYYKFYVHFVNKYGEVSQGIPISRYDKNIDGFSNNYIDKPNVIISDDYLFCVKGPNFKDINNLKFCYTKLNINIDDLYNTDIYNYCSGFFLSYEKYEETINFTGMLFNYDFDKEYDEINEFKNYTNEDNNSNKFRFYSNEIDSFDVLELKSKIIKYLFINFKTYKPNVVIRKELKEGIYFDKNTINIEPKDDLSILPESSGYMSEILDIKYIPAHSFINDNDYRGSYLEITINPKHSFGRFGKEGVLCNLYSSSDFLYKSENKQLIKFTNIFYFDDRDIPIGYNKDISNGLNGFVTFNQALIYNNDKVILNSGYNILVNKKYNAYLGNPVIGSEAENPDEKIANKNAIHIVVQYNFPCTKSFPYELKKFKVLPEIIITRTEALSDTISQAVFETAVSTIIQPINSIDLYEFDIYSQDYNNPKIYFHFVKEFITEFNKRVNRSYPIADESFANNWRIFDPEQYKDITENKGDITNLVAMGTTMLVHTEHSLFMFDRDNTLQNGQAGAIQLAMPDVFDIDYKEVFSSNLGTCGLQDLDAWILDEFGYIFYDNDANRIYKFSTKKIDVIDLAIVQFLNRFKPDKVRFFNDEERNRILVYLRYNEFDNRYQKLPFKEMMLSYNHVLNKWISEHDYIFEDGFNTKQKLYIIKDTKNKVFNFNFGNTDTPNNRNARQIAYNYFDIFDNIEDKYRYSTISIIVNDSYELMKTLEFITWKLYKIVENQTTKPAREVIREPYSGFKLRVYNDNIDTGNLYINILPNTKNLSVMNYKKPWWEYDNWNFNYLRDVKNSTTPIAQLMSRLYGNYFIIELQLNDITVSNYHERIEFETLNCQLISNKTI